MAALEELELPTIDYRDPALTGAAFRDTLRELRERSWVARAEPLGWFVLDHEATAFFLRTRSATFPGRLVLEVQGVTSGPLYERLKGNLLDLDGEPHKRLRKAAHPRPRPATRTSGCASSSTTRSRRRPPTRCARRCASSSRSCSPPTGAATSSR